MLQKKDKLLIFLIIIAAGIIAFGSSMLRNKSGSYVRVMIDGQIYGEYSLQENRTIEIWEAAGYNRIAIAQGSIKMQEADCPDQYCVRHEAITSTNETIVCLPHRLTVEIVGDATDNQGNIDVLAQ